MVGSLQKVLDKAKKDRFSANSRRGSFQAKSHARSSSEGPDYKYVRQVNLNMDTVLENYCVCAHPEVIEGDYYRVLRTQIQHVLSEKDWRTIMITSTVPNEGKTLTCINLAFSFAKAYDQTVMLIDADLKKQHVHKALGITSQYGIMDYLVRNQPIQDCLIRPIGENLVLISGGEPVAGSSELLGSRVMNSFVQDARDRYEDRLVFFDAPPIMAGADALAFAPMVDGIVFVVRSGHTSTKQARTALDLLPSEKLIGVVLNGKETNIKSYNYY